MKTALFTNFSKEEFIGYWNGKGKKFAPGQSLYMQDFLARHFAKHLTNRELLRKDENGNPVYPDGEKFTSPKFPEQVPQFMELFNQAYTPDEMDELGEEKEDIDSLIEVANKNRGKKVEVSNMLPEHPAPKAKKEKQDPTKPQIIEVPDDEDDEEFGGKPKEDDAAKTIEKPMTKAEKVKALKAELKQLENEE